MYKLVVLSSVLTLAAAKPGIISPLGVAGVGLAALWTAPLISPLAAPIAAPLALGAPNYRGPLSLAPGQPANILAIDGRPLDTLSVNLDRAAHLTAKAVDGAGLHLLKKRSAPLLASPLLLRTAIAPPPLALSATPIVSAPLAAPFAAPLAAPLALSAAHLGSATPLVLGHGASLGKIW